MVRLGHGILKKLGDIWQDLANGSSEAKTS